MSKAQRVMSMIAAGSTSTLVLCCGGLTALAAIVGPAPQKAPNPRPTATRVAATPADTTSPASAPPAAPPTDVPTTPGAPPTTQAPAPPPPPVKTTEAAPPPPPPKDVYYANCDAVRAAGAAPLYIGQPGYRPGLDRDHDGVACE